MKNQITLNLAALLFGAIILFSSCTKKDLLEMPDKQNAALFAPAQSSNALANFLKGVPAWYYCGGGSLKTGSRPVNFIAYGKYVYAELHKSVSGNPPVFVASTSGDWHSAILSFSATEGVTYYFKVVPYNGTVSCWIPLMEFGQKYVLETSKYGTCLNVIATAP